MARKLIGALAILCLILAAGAYYVSRADSDGLPEPVHVTRLAGIRLGMSPTDVTVTLGKPTAAAATEVDEGGRAHLTYVYAKDHNTDYSLEVTFFGPDRLSMRAVVICEKGGFASLLGFDRYSSEEAIVGTLGAPSHSSVRSDGLEKAISYDAWNTSFKIARGKVSGLCIHQGKFIQYDKEAASARRAS